VRVLVADNHAWLGVSVQLVLLAQPELEVVGRARDAAEAWHMALDLSPDVVLLDADMSSGIQALARLRRDAPAIRIVVQTSDEETSALARRLGAADCVMKGEPPATVLDAIRRASVSSTPRKSVHEQPPPA
jgi:DNA-binding NarL/FixJ family response regulator